MEGTNGNHLLHLHDDRESNKRGYIVCLYSCILLIGAFHLVCEGFNLTGCLRGLHTPANTLKLKLDAPHAYRDTLYFSSWSENEVSECFH